MATLVFSTVGTILGGPIGGAIGALLGQSIDEQILGPSSRGPKLGDLSVQTSSYGTQIPRIYGTMRVAGSVIWSTDLVQSEQTSGAKGQPGMTYSYAVSFAVALSARRVTSIGRIWADGKLLRGAEGDFKVPTQFRFYDGSEDQEIDPLIASVETIELTPAYRGLALAVFEGLELAEYGNRIPFLTFEVVADEEPPAIGSILADSSAGAIDSTAAQTVGGYAAYGASIRAAAEPLVETFAVRLFDDGERVREPGTAGLAPIAEAEFGFGLDDERPARARRELDPASALPGEFRLNYYDPARDYQSGEARASVGDETGREVRSELPAVIAADAAKGMAQHLLARAWARRDRLTLHLPPARLAIEPGTLLELPVTPRNWTVERVVVEGFVPRIELRPYVDEAIAPVVATSGSVSSASDVVEADLAVALVEVPDPTGAQQSPQVLLAASSASAGWPQRSVEIVRGSTTTVVATARRKAVLGNSLTALGPGPAHVVDRVNSVDVELVDPAQWLTSCDETALLDGRNLAVLGGELIQFGSVEPLEAGRFRLHTLLRGRYGSEGRASAHAVGESFILYEPDALVVLPLPPFAIGSVLGAEPAWKGQSTAITVTGASLRPPVPVGVWSETQGDGSLAVGWTRRSRTGWAWLDEVDAPLGETLERYRLTVTSASASVEQIATQTSADVPPADLASLGAGPWTISVRQLGDYVASDAATAIHYPA